MEKDREISLQDKVDVAWDYLSSVNPPEKPAVSISPVEEKILIAYVNKLKAQGRKKRFIDRAVLRKFKINLL